MMRTMMFKIVMLIWFALIAAASAATQSPSPVTAQVQHANAAIAEFDRTHSIADLDTARQALEAAGSRRLSASDRSIVLGGYLALFGAVDRAMPSLPPGQRPLVSVMPPRVNGVRYPAGIAPSAISDPAARARYEQAIRKNEVFTEQFLAAAALRQADDLALLVFSDFAHDAFKGQTDSASLRRQIEASPLTQTRKARLLKVLG